MPRKKRKKSSHVVTGPVTTAGPITDVKRALAKAETKEQRHTRLHLARRAAAKKD